MPHEKERVKQSGSTLKASSMERAEFLRGGRGDTGDFLRLFRAFYATGNRRRRKIRGQPAACFVTKHAPTQGGGEKHELGGRKGGISRMGPSHVSCKLLICVFRVRLQHLSSTHRLSTCMRYFRRSFCSTQLDLRPHFR